MLEAPSAGPENSAKQPGRRKAAGCSRRPAASYRLQYYNAVWRPQSIHMQVGNANSSTRYHPYRTVPLPTQRQVTLENSPPKVRAAKMSETTPCTVAGGRHGCLESDLSRSASSYCCHRPGDCNV